MLAGVARQKPRRPQFVRIKVTKAQMSGLDITGDQFHPGWNYTIKPRPS